MPRPPQHNDLAEVSFIINYFVQGCVPPLKLFVEFSRAPAKKAFLLMFSLSFADIIKGWLRPRRGRSRNPGRHGRKRGFRAIPLDINELIGSNMPGHGDIYPGLALPGAKAVFALHDKWEHVAWTAAVVSGLTDIGFETLHGILTSHPEHCPDYAFVNRSEEGHLPVSGIYPPFAPLVASVLDSAQNMASTGPESYLTFKGPMTCCWSGLIQAINSDLEDFVPTIRRVAGSGLIDRGSTFSLAQGETAEVTVSGEVEVGESWYPARDVGHGAVNIYDFQVFGFSGTWL